MSRKKKEYNIMVKQPTEEIVYGCRNKAVLNKIMFCDGDCNSCEYQIIVRKYKKFK